MRVSTAVESLSSTLLVHMNHHHSDEVLAELIERIGSIGSYVAQGRVDNWDSLVQDYQIDELKYENNPYFKLARMVFDLGRYNLYCAFDAVGTRALYAKISISFSNLGIEVSTLPLRALRKW